MNPVASTTRVQEDEALEALRIISAALTSAKLKHLNLSDNALGEKGVRAAADVLTRVCSVLWVGCDGFHVLCNLGAICVVGVLC